MASFQVAGISIEERLTRQFYDWEMRGRGWQVWHEPVEIEPPFRPFYGHYMFDLSPSAMIDDGRKPTFLSSIADGLKSLVRRSSSRSENSIDALIEEPEPEPCASTDADPLIEIQVALSPQTKIAKDAAEQFLMSLGHVSRPISFEVIGTATSIVVQVACCEADCKQVREQLHAFFPDALLTDRPDYLRSVWIETGSQSTIVVDFGLSHEFMRPLHCFERFDPDPLAGIVGAMTGLTDDQVSVLQILFAPTRHPWPESVLRAVTDGCGESFFQDDEAMESLAGQKISRPLFAAIVRVGAQSASYNRTLQLAQGVGKSLRQFSDATSNEFIPLTNDNYNDGDHARDLVARQSRRVGMLLNSDELVSLVHLPSVSVRSEKLKRDERKTNAAPAIASGHRLFLGENCHSGKTVPVTLSPDQRVRHSYVLGASGTGKSTLLLNLIVQDIENGEGLAVLDPHGDLIDQVLARIPEERIADVVLLDPSDADYPVGFNVLSAHSELERNLLASDLVSVFRRLSTSWGDQMNTVLANAIMAFLESTTGGTLSDLRRFLVEADYRQSMLQTVRDPEIVYYWQKEFPLLSGKPQAPILTRLDAFLRPKLIRYMVSQKDSRLDFGAIMNGRKILLAKLAQGLIGEENSYLLGTFLVSKLNQMAMSRQDIDASARTNFYLYLDEFHNFVTPSLSAILAGARKYRLGLVLAHQELHQLMNRDSDVASAVISNSYTRVCFRLGDFDAKKLEDGFSHFTAKDLQNLSVGESICRIERSDYDFNLKTNQLPPIDPDVAAIRREQIVASSRARYATPREEVEATLRANYPSIESDQTTEKPRPPKMKASIPLSTPAITASILETQSVPDIHTPGRGGEHHKYLQQLIKRWAEARGYVVTIEKPILDGLGSVDVALEAGEQSIACEISVSTMADHELGNIQKCLAAGFTQIVLVSSEKTLLTAAKAAVFGAVSAEQCRKIKFLTPEQVFSFIESLVVQETKAAPRRANPNPNDLLTAKEVEEMLRINVKTVYSYVQKGLLPYVKIQSNVRFVRSEILKWMEEKQYRPGGRGTRK